MSRRFSVGDVVRTVVENPPGHTRLPGYARGRRGVVEAAHDDFQVPEEAAAGVSQPQRRTVYTVSFDAGELWGEDAEAGSTIRMEVWEHQLTAASDTAGEDAR